MLKVYGTGNDLNLQETYRLCNCMITTISQQLEQFSTPSTGIWRLEKGQDSQPPSTNLRTILSNNSSQMILYSYQDIKCFHQRSLGKGMISNAYH